MELNDVFKANNYAGRKKVLDRFPLSKEDKDNVNKSIERLSSSSGGGGNDEELVYYKTNRSEVNLQSMQTMRFAPIVKFIAGDPNSLNGIEMFIPQDFLIDAYGDGRYIAGFAISRKSIYLWVDGTYILTSGSMEERVNDIINYLLSIGHISNEDVPAFKEQILVPFNEYCTQCTKEEYESLITSKPE